MNIYENPALYARTVRITERLARIWCDHQQKLMAQVEKASFCPKCGKPTLEWELGSYEEGNEDYIYCSNYEVPYVNEEDGEQWLGDCDYMSDIKTEHEPLAHWYTFDHLLALNRTNMNVVEEFGGLKKWFTFAKKDIEEILG